MLALPGGRLAFELLLHGSVTGPAMATDPNRTAPAVTQAMPIPSWASLHRINYLSF